MPTKKTPDRRKSIFVTLATVILLAVIVAMWLHFRPFNKKASTIPSSTSAGQSVSNQTPPQNQAGGNNIPSSSGNSAGTSSQSPPPRTSLIAPWGNFVSNHFPGQNGAPTTETSSCNTTPGATCYIRFTSGSRTRTLDSKVADANGAVIWNWDVKAAGFGSGAWKITAIASLNGQTKTAEDSLSLDIQ